MNKKQHMISIIAGAAYFVIGFAVNDITYRTGYCDGFIGMPYLYFPLLVAFVVFMIVLAVRNKSVGMLLECFAIISFCRLVTAGLYEFIPEPESQVDGGPWWGLGWDLYAALEFYLFGLLFLISGVVVLVKRRR